MVDIFNAIILGIVEGITEFLPVSSTGHLILANEFVTFTQPFTHKFDIIIQLGAILAVVLIYRYKLIPKNNVPVQPFVTLWLKIIVAVIPALFFGALLHEVIETHLFNPVTVAVTLIFWGIILIVIEKIYRTPKTDTLTNLGYKTAFLIGLFQCLAMVPGTSRSAVTIIGAMLLGSTRVVAVEFSFFLAIPTLCAASVFSFFKLGFAVTLSELVILGIGFVTSFIVAWVVIRFFINYISTRNFILFGYYRIVLGLIVLLYFMLVK